MQKVTSYSEYEVTKIGFKFEGEDAYVSVACVGSSEEEMEQKAIKKKCRGVETTVAVKGTGKGTVKVSLHIPIAVYDNFYGMKLDSLIDGVTAYGRNSRHKRFAMVQEVEDENGILKNKAYPSCIVETGKKSKVENGGEEVAEIEIEIAVAPDEFGNGVYEAIPDNLDEEGKAKIADWMTAFTPEMVQLEQA